jgi:hypothetical protein
MKRFILLCILSTFIVLPLFSSAVPGMEMGPASGSRHGISFMTGGVGMGERAQMEKMSGEYNLKIILATSSGSYLAKIPIMIYDNKGTLVFQAESEGPWFYVRLPEGGYTIKATYDGHEKKKMINITRGLKMVMFHWAI